MYIFTFIADTDIQDFDVTLQKLSNVRLQFFIIQTKVIYFKDISNFMTTDQFLHDV